MKPAQKLTPEDMRLSPVWEFIDEPEAHMDETWVRPVKPIPVRSMDGRIVLSEVLANDGTSYAAMIGNLSLENERKTKLFLSYGIYVDGEWVNVSRYFDVDYDRAGPSDLARRLGKSEGEIFPIRYDISAIAIGSDACVRGEISDAPSEILSDDERLDLIFSE